MLRIRFQRMGKRNRPYFRIVVTERSFPPKGKFIEKLGFWDPIKKVGNFDEKRIKYWIEKGAQVSDSCWNLFVKKGIIKGKKRKIQIVQKKKDKK